MIFYSTNNKQLQADFRQATITGQAPDKGLYYPSSLPRLSNEFITKLKNYSKEQIAFNIFGLPVHQSTGRPVNYIVGTPFTVVYLKLGFAPSCTIL